MYYDAFWKSSDKALKPACACADPKPGDRVESFYSLDPTDVHSRGVLVGVRGDGTHYFLIDPDAWKPNGQPMSARADQIRPEVSIGERAYAGLREVNGQITRVEIIHQAQMERATKCFPWRRAPKPLNERGDYLALQTARTAFLTTIELDRRLVELEPKVANVGHEIVYETADGLKAEGFAMATTTQRENVECKFLCEFRGWRFIQFHHGGITAYPAADVRPLPDEKPKRKPKKEGAK